MLPSTFYIMWPMHQQSLMLLHPKVKEKMHLQEIILFDLDLRVTVDGNVVQDPQHCVTNADTKFEVATSNGLGGDTFTRNVTYNGLTINIRLFSKVKAGIITL